MQQLKNGFLAFIASSRPKANAVPCISFVPDFIPNVDLRPASRAEFSFAIGNDVELLNRIERKNGRFHGPPIGLFSSHQSSTNVRIGGVRPSIRYTVSSA